MSVSLWPHGHPMDCWPLNSSLHGVFQVRILEWIAVPFSRASSWSRDWTLISFMSPALKVDSLPPVLPEIPRENRWTIKDKTGDLNSWSIQCMLRSQDSFWYIPLIPEQCGSIIYNCNHDPKSQNHSQLFSWLLCNMFNMTNKNCGLYFSSVYM